MAVTVHLFGLSKRIFFVKYISEENQRQDSASLGITALAQARWQTASWYHCTTTSLHCRTIGMLLVAISGTVTSAWAKQFMKQKFSFNFVSRVLEVSAHSHLALLFLCFCEAEQHGRPKLFTVWMPEWEKRERSSGRWRATGRKETRYDLLSHASSHPIPLPRPHLFLPSPQIVPPAGDCASST